MSIENKKRKDLSYSYSHFYTSLTNQYQQTVYSLSIHMAELIQFNEVTQPFKEFSDSHKHNVLTNVMTTINLATRNQPEQFFEYLLESSVGKNLILPIVYEKKVKPVMKNISDHYNTAAQEHKLSILSMVVNYFSLKELVSFGFPICRIQHDSARNKDKKKSRSTNPVKKPIRKDSELMDSILVKLIQLCLENSKSSRLKKVRPSTVKHLDIPGYDIKKNYELTKTKSDIYFAFKTTYPQFELTKASFYKYIPQNFIAPKVPPKTASKPTSKKPRGQRQLNNLNQTDDITVQSSSNYSNSVSDAVIPSPLPNPNYSNSPSVIQAPPLPPNSNCSNSANTMVASSLPSDQNHSSSTSILIPSPSQYYSGYPNSERNVSVPPLSYNVNYSNPTSNMRAPSLPSNPNHSNSVGDMRAPTNPNQSSFTSDMGTSSSLTNPNQSNSANDTIIPSEASRFYLSSFSFDTQRPF